MMAVLGLIPSWAWRWIAIVAVAAAAGGFFYVRGMAHVQVQFDAYEAKVKAEGQRQNELTQQIIKAQQQRMEQANVDAQLRENALNSDLDAARMRLAQTRSSRSLLPAPSASSGGDKRLCLARDVLAKGIGELAGGLEEQILQLARKGQQGIDVAVTCRDWAKGQ